MSRRSTYQERYDSQGYFAPGDVLDDSASGTETTSNEVIDGSPGAAKRINAKPYEPVDYSKNPYENSNNEYLKPVTPGNTEPTVVKRKVALQNRAVKKVVTAVAAELEEVVEIAHVLMRRRNRRKMVLR